MSKINVCPSLLKPGYDTFSPVARKNLLNGKKVSHILPYETLSARKEQTSGRGHLSLSGAQTKYSAVIDNGEFRLAEDYEQGTYILKPILSDWENREYSPANENLTMQIASQVYGIQTAENAVCFTKNGEQVYVTKRYDVNPDGTKIQQEDFASLAGLNRYNSGDDYKYNALNYVDIANIIKRFIPAWRIELVKYFDLILFNFVFSNGDAHIKNFSVIQTPQGDYKLAPAYDLINTSMHIYYDSIFALQKGLYEGWNREMGADGKDFIHFGKLIGLEEATISKEMDKFCNIYDKTQELIDNSFLSDELKKQYRISYQTRVNSFLKIR